MKYALQYLDDFQLAQSCVDGDVAAIERFLRIYRSTVTAFLFGCGATYDEAREVTENLWADCVTGNDERAARLARYDGTCALQTWLNTVALNRLLSHKRTELRRIATLSNDDLLESAVDEGPIPGDTRQEEEELRLRAIGVALRELPPKIKRAIMSYREYGCLKGVASELNVSTSSAHRLLRDGCAFVKKVVKELNLEEKGVSAVEERERLFQAKLQATEGAIGNLSPKLRAVADLIRQGMSESEIAAELEIPLGTVRSRRDGIRKAIGWSHFETMLAWNNSARVVDEQEMMALYAVIDF